MIRFINPNADTALTAYLRQRIGQSLGDAVTHSVECLPDSVQTIGSPADAARAEVCLAEWLAHQPFDTTIIVLASVDTGVAAAVRAGRRAHGFFELVLGDHARRGEPVELLTVGANMTASYRALVQTYGMEHAVLGIDTIDAPVATLTGPDGGDRLVRQLTELGAVRASQPLWIVGVATLPASDAARARVPAVIDPIGCMIRELRHRSFTECTNTAKTTPISF